MELYMNIEGNVNVPNIRFDGHSNANIGRRL